MRWFDETRRPSSELCRLSLNDCLHAGPISDEKVMDLLLRFQIHRVALIAGIKKAFLMVGMSKKDPDMLWLLWSYMDCGLHTMTPS